MFERMPSFIMNN